MEWSVFSSGNSKAKKNNGEMTGEAQTSDVSPVPILVFLSKRVKAFQELQVPAVKWSETTIVSLERLSQPTVIQYMDLLKGCSACIKLSVHFSKLVFLLSLKDL